MSAYPFLLVLHLLAAVVFAGAVFFEVLMLESVRSRLPRQTMAQVERAIADRARRMMPWVLLILYGAGIGMAVRYRELLAQPLASSFGLLLGIKILLAASVFLHFTTAMAWRRRGVLSGGRARQLHLSVFAHLVLIIVLAKAMFHLTW